MASAVGLTGVSGCRYTSLDDRRVTGGSRLRGEIRIVRDDGRFRSDLDGELRDGDIGSVEYCAAITEGKLTGVACADLPGLLEEAFVDAARLDKHPVAVTAFHP